MTAVFTVKEEAKIEELKKNQKNKTVSLVSLSLHLLYLCDQPWSFVLT